MKFHVYLTSLAANIVVSFYIHASAGKVTVDDPVDGSLLSSVYIGGSALNLTGSTDSVTGPVDVISADGIYVSDAADVARTIERADAVFSLLARVHGYERLDER